MTPAVDHERPPEAVITASCPIDEGSFADVDADGVDDLVLRSDDSVYAWASSRGPGQPVWWKWSVEGEASWFEISTPNDGPPRVNWLGIYPDSSDQYRWTHRRGDGALSRVHLLVVRVDGVIWAIDTASTNGTRHNGVAVPACAVSDAASLLLARSCVVRWAAAPPAN